MKAEVLIDLEEGLVLPGELEIGFGFFKGAEEAFAAAFYFLIGRGGADFGEGIPIFEIEWIKGVDEEFFETGFPEELDGFFSPIGLKGVVVIPKRFVEFGGRF